MLNADVGQRCDVIQLRISPWMRGQVQALCPYSQIKHRPEVCLPQEIFSFSSHYQPQSCPGSSGHIRPHYPHTAQVYTPPLIQPLPVSQRQTSAGQRKTSAGHTQQPSTSSNQTHTQTAQYAVQKHRPLKSRLGAAGRKIANAVLHVSHTQTATNSDATQMYDQ